MTQKLHLMIGTSPFLSCHFCTTPRDYQLFSIGHHLFQFAASLILFGLLTVRFDSLEVFDEVVYSLLEMTLGKDMRLAAVQANQEAGQLRADGHIYRIPLLYLLSSFLLAQAAVYLNLIDASFGHGRWDHVSACREGMPSMGLTHLATRTVARQFQHRISCHPPRLIDLDLLCTADARKAHHARDCQLNQAISLACQSDSLSRPSDAPDQPGHLERRGSAPSSGRMVRQQAGLV